MTRAATPFTAHSATAKLACERRGRGAPLLLIPGLALDQRLWGPRFLARLGETHEVITFDHRGVGGSSTAGAFTAADLAADAVAVLDWAGVADAHVLGFALGGAVAQLLALEHPERLRSLTLVATFAEPDALGVGVVKLLAASRSRDREASASLLHDAVFPPGGSTDHEQCAGFLRAAADWTIDARVLARQVQVAAEHDALNRLRAVRTPALVVHGTRDEIVDVAAGERVAGALGNARLELWPGLGHHLPWQAADRLADAVLAHTGAGP